MTIKIVTGNAVSALLNKEVTYLLHVTNCKQKMGSGVALEIKKRIPFAFASYIESTPMLGCTSFGDGVWNMNAQENYGYDGKRYLNYGALSDCLRNVAVYSEEGDSFAVPHGLGSDRAGGSWEIVKELIEWHLGEFDITYYKL